MSGGIFEFMAEDHDRLDGLFREFQSLMGRNPAAARAKLREFDEGLRRHIVWEEGLLFPLYERVSVLSKDGPTSVMRSEHVAILDALAALAAIEAPGRWTEPPYRWEADPVLWRGKPLVEGAYS